MRIECTSRPGIYGILSGAEMMKKQRTAVCLAFALSLWAAVSAAFTVDRAVMSDRYWEIWNDEVQAKIDADIEKYRKADAAVEVSAPAATTRTRNGSGTRSPVPRRWSIRSGAVPRRVP